MTRWASFTRALMGARPVTVVAVATLALILLLAALAPVLAMPSPNAIATRERLLPPLATGHPLGTDELGRDLLSRMIWGGRVSVAAGVGATLGALIPGIGIGAVCGYRGGWLDIIAMRIMEIILAFPVVLLAIAVVAVMGPGLNNAVLAISLVGIPAYARVARALVLGAKQCEYVDAARVCGATDVRIVSRHVMPNVAPSLIVLASLDVGQKMIALAALSFLGLGSQPPQSDWGAMLASGRGYLALAPHLVFFPGLATAAFVFAVTVLGDAITDSPRLMRGPIT